MATKYLIAGGNYSSDTIWSSSSGGANDVTHPTSADDVICDANSGNVTLTVDVASAFKTLDQTNFTGTLTGSGDLQAYGNITFGASMTQNWTGILYPYAAINLKTNGKSFKQVYCNNFNNIVTLLDNLTLTGRGDFIGKGLVTNNYSIACTAFNSSGSVTRTLTLGSSQITCTSLDLSGTNLTITTNTAKFIVNQAASGTMIFDYGTTQFYDLELNGFNDKLSQKLFAGNLTVTNQLTLKGQSAINRLWIRSDTIGTRRTLSAGSVVLENVDFQDITFAGAATWSGTSVGDAQGNSGTITYTTPVTAKWRKSGGSGNWSDPTSWDTGVVPLCHDNVRFDADSILASGKTITADMPRLGKDISFEGCLNTPALSFSNASNYIFGSPTFISGMTFSGDSRYIIFNSRSDFNFTSGGFSFNRNILVFNNYNCNVFLQDALNLTQGSADNQWQIEIRGGTFNTNNFPITSSKIACRYANCTVNLGSSKIYITGNGVTPNSTLFMNQYANITTINPGTSELIFSSTSANGKDLTYVGKTYNNIKINGTGGSFNIINSNTFNQLESDTTAGAHTITLTAGTTQTIQKLIVNSEPTKKTTINSTSATKANLNSPNDNFIKNAVLENIAFGGTGTWYYDPSTVTVTDCTGLTAKNFNTFNTAKNVFNETKNKFGGNFTAKY